MDLEKTVRAAFELREPAPDFEDAVMARVSAAAWRASRVRPRKRQILLIGTLLVSAAAAAMLGSAIRRVMAPQVIAGSGASRPAVASRVSSAAAAAAVTAPASANFTVHLRLLQHASTDAAVLGKVREYYAAIADGLRAVPGLQLIDDRAAEAADTPASFRITIDNPDVYIAGQMLTRGEWAVTFEVEVLKAGVYVPAQGWTRGGAYGPASMAAQATGGPLSGTGCPMLILCSPAAIAAWQIKDLRIQLFPFEPSLQLELEARLLDPARSFLEQRDALNDLHDVGEKTRRPMSTPVVRRVLQQIANERDPGERGVLWYFLGGQRDPQMIQPLINAAQQDPDDSVRLGAAAQLAVDFPSIPAVRTALQSIATRDPVLLNRKVAERAISGDAPWIDYVVVTAKDTTQPVQQRLAPLRWMMTEQSNAGTVGSGTNPLAPISRPLFGRDRQAFIDLFAQAVRESTRPAPTPILEAIGTLKHPESAGFLLAVFDAAPDPARLHLLKDHLDDSRVLKRVEELAADSTIPTLQATAAGMLRGE